MSRVKIIVVEGKLSRDTETFGNMDPYISIKCLGEEYKTPVHQNGGKKPKWNHTLEITFQSD